MNPTNSHPVKLLRVQTDYFVAGAIWEKIGGFWSCTKAAPIIRWMKGQSPEQTARKLLRLSADYQWIP